MYFFFISIIASFFCFASYAESPVDFNVEPLGYKNGKYYLHMQMNTLYPYKSYWKFAGFGGISPNYIKERDQANIHSVQFHWGHPILSQKAGLTNYILPSKADILIEITPQYLQKQIVLSGVLEYGYCHKQCQFGQKKLNISLGHSLATDKKLDALLHTLRPTPLHIDKVVATRKGKAYHISFDLSSLEPVTDRNLFYIFDQEYEITQPQIKREGEGNYHIDIMNNSLYYPPKTVEILFVKSDGTLKHSIHSLTFN